MNESDSRFWTTLQDPEFLIGSGCILCYCIAGAILLNRWIMMLDVDDPYRQVALGSTAYTEQMVWAIFVVNMLFILTWPVFALIRLLYTGVDYLTPDPDVGDGAVEPVDASMQIEDKTPR